MQITCFNVGSAPVQAVVESPWSGCPNITIEDFSLEGSDEGDDDDNLACYRKILLSIQESQNSRPSHTVLTFSRSLAGGSDVSWQVMICNKQLFVYISQLADFSKECFMALLDYAESCLHSNKAYVVFPLSVNNAQRKKLIQNFRFLGFETLLPSSAPVQSYTFMGYEMESSSDSDDDD